MINCNERLLQRVTSDFLQRATSATSNEWFWNEWANLERVRRKFHNDQREALQRVMSKDWICNE